MLRVAPLAVLLSVALPPSAAPLAAQGLHLPLSADSAVRLEFGGQLRLRAEGWNDFAFGAGAADDAFALSRLLYHGELRVRSALAVFVEIKSSLATNRTLPGGRRAIDEDVLDVQQLYADVGTGLGDWRLSARAGRADLAFGRERLVSPLDWVNTRRTFQGASASLAGPTLTVQAFWARPVQVRQRQPNIADSTRQIFGVYATRTWPGPRLTADAYWLRSEARSASYNGTSGYERRHTVGYRLARRAPAMGGFDADVEVAAQFGSVGAENISALLAGAQAGWTLEGAMAPRVYLGVDFGGGDRAAGGDVRTASQLYPLGHAYLGFVDVHGRQNILDLSAGASLKATRRLSLMLDVHHFRRVTTADGLYGVDGSLARGPGSSVARNVGTEVDLTARHPFLGQRLWLQGGVSRYLPGGFIRDTGPSRAISWGYLQAALSL